MNTDEFERKMREKLETARMHRECAPGNCYVGNPNECPHQAAEVKTDPKTGQQVTKKPERQLLCPECQNQLDTLEVSYGRGVTQHGIWVTESGNATIDHSGHTDDLGDIETIGAMCSACDWKIERPDWFEYLKDYEANEIKRIQEEFKAVKRGEDPPTQPPRASSWPVDLVPGHIKVVIPVKDGNPIEMTLDMAEMDGPQDIHVDPEKGTVSFESDEPFTEERA